MPRVLNIPLNAGQREKIAPKHAPFGVLRVGKNLRHREQGGLGMRYGYQPLGNDTLTGTLVAHDLHEYQGRLLALGSDQLEGYPHDVLEYTGIANQTWRSAQGSGCRYAVSPFTNAREVAGVPQLEGGSSLADACSGGGYTLLVYVSNTTSHTFACIVDSATNQTVHFEDMTNGAGFSDTIDKPRAAYAGGKFFVQAIGSDNSLHICSFTVGSSSAFAAFATVDGSNANSITAHDLVPVTHGTTALLCSAYDRSTHVSLAIKVWQSDGTQLGSTITTGAASVDTRKLALDADQADDTILLATVETSTTAQLRTLQFDGTLLAGPTTLTAGSRIGVARRDPGSGSQVAYTYVQDGSDTVIQSCNVDDHSSLATFQKLYNATPTSRLYNYQGPTPSLVLGCIFGSGADLTNALVHMGGGAIHAMTRDYLTAVATASTLPPALTYDSTTGALCWCVLRNQEGTIGTNPFPAVTLVDYRSTARIQAVTYGGLRYFTGATPWIYDGRAAVESNFLEPPTIVSVTPDSSAGSMTPSATYTYVAHWEVTFADGSYIESAPSSPVDVTMGASDTETTLVVTGPHSLHAVLGQSALGASVLLVISRTEWSPTTIDPVSGAAGSQFSVFRRAIEESVSCDLSTYGQSTTTIDGTADATLGTRAAIYTQADRGEFSGPVEHNALESCSYITASESRILTGGLVRPFEVQSSLEAFLGQPFAWSFLSNFYGLVSEPVRGVYSLDGIRLVFTLDAIYALQSGAPDDEGKGSLGLPVRLPAPCGLKDWRSLVEEQGGLWCQLDDDKLMRIPHGAGSPEWLGVDVQKTLASYPTITAAARHKADNVVLFAACNSGLTDARILVRDNLFQTWFVDTPPLESGHAIEAMTVFGRRLAYISNGVVYAQTIGSFTDGTSTFIDMQAELEPIYPFELGGYGLIHDVLFVGEYRGDCVLTLSVSYDDGQTYAYTQSWTISGLTSGDTVMKRWALPQVSTQSVVIKIDVTTNGAPSEGLVLNALALLVHPESGLPELAPGDMA